MCARACVGGGLCPLKRIVSSSLVLYSYLQNDPNESSCGITDTFLATQGEKQKKNEASWESLSTCAVMVAAPGMGVQMMIR